MSPTLGRRGLAGYSQELVSGSVDAPASPTILPGSGTQQNTQPPGAIFVGQYTYTSAAFVPLTGGPVGKVPAAVVAAAKQLAVQGRGQVTVGQFLLQVESFFYNQADYTTVINVYALPDAPAGPIVTAPAVQAKAPPSNTFHDKRGVGAPMISRPSWRPHNGTVPAGLGAAPKLHKGQWIARHNGLVYMHPRAGFGAVAANDPLSGAIQGLLTALSTSAGNNGGTALCSDVTAAASQFQTLYNAQMGGSLDTSGTYDAATQAALNTAIAAYNPSGQASIQSFTSGSAPAACTNTASGSSSSPSPSPAPAPTPAATATVTTSSNTPLYVAGAAVLALGAYYAWKKKII